MRYFLTLSALRFLFFLRLVSLVVLAWVVSFVHRSCADCLFCVSFFLLFFLLWEVSRSSCFLSVKATPLAPLMPWSALFVFSRLSVFCLFVFVARLVAFSCLFVFWFSETPRSSASPALRASAQLDAVLFYVFACLVCCPSSSHV